jgi:hypothetical protein
MPLPWTRYPAGADIKLFDETMHIVIARTGKRYETSLALQPHGSGVLNVAGDAKTIDEAISNAEAWLAEHCRTILVQRG